MKLVYKIPFKVDRILKKAKDKIDKLQNKNVVYKLNCNDCDKCYVGQSSRFLHSRLKEHIDNAGYKNKYHTVVSKHIKQSLTCDD